MQARSLIGLACCSIFLSLTFLCIFMISFMEVLVIRQYRTGNMQYGPDCDNKYI